MAGTFKMTDIAEVEDGVNNSQVYNYEINQRKKELETMIGQLQNNGAKEGEAATVVPMQVLQEQLPQNQLDAQQGEA